MNLSPARPLLASAALGALLMSSACSGDSQETVTEAATTSATTEAPSTTPASAKPTTTQAPEPVEPMDRMVTIDCTGEDISVKHSFRSIREAWDTSAEDRKNCHVSSISATNLHEREREALETAYGPDSDSLDILYAICAESMLGDADEILPYSEGQRDEIEGALILCPDHPDADEIRGRMDAAAETDDLRAEGRVFATGTYRVGEDVQPGSYASEAGDEPFDGCYWELLDEAGDIIDNNFVNSGFRVEIHVPSSAYSLTVDGCGEFQPVE